MKMSDLISDLRGANATPHASRWLVNGLEAVLTAAIVVEVEKRHGMGVRVVEADAIKSVAAALARQDNARFGLLLCGSVGTGKTTTALAIIRAANYVRKIGGVSPEYRFISARNVQNGLGCAVVVDDVGVEAAEVVEFGNVRAPIAQLIEDLYERRYSFVLTTNLKPQTIGERYGERVADRLRECCEVVIMTGRSRR